ncbi:PREDICTED: uncharacterized protein LOC104599958 [Nelumbo nucifera]|uniref:Holocarboxylase synthetase n=2 Tax=Nelumbo nucifera TaxID=4432 RepID=A0A822Z5J6_NELNU|nr:PREDICTED: uncharacterized protein LOC104599958 [Nelumbo nucifera]DAD40117.1 TPA_asm: hypothetical protein HUJ06_014440 [Nelumbo nucifera]
MGKKRKSDATRLDEVDRTMYTTFCSAANSLSQLYTQAMNHQKVVFQAGERHGLEKLYQWILRQQEEGSRVMTTDILAYLQNEIDYGGEEPPMSPRLPFQNQQTQPTMHFMNPPMAQVSSGSFGPALVGQAPRSINSEHQSKNSVFSNALSSPVRRSLQHYHLAQGSYHPNSIIPPGNGTRNAEASFAHHHNRDSNSPFSNDSSMDMHADSPGQESSY